MNLPTASMWCASVAITLAGMQVQAQESTAGVECRYQDSTINNSPSVNATAESEWSCSDTTRRLIANGLPDHSAGNFPNRNNPHAIEVQSIDQSFTLTPKKAASATVLDGPSGQGYALNGIKIEAGTAGSCDDSGNNCSMRGRTGNWHIEAFGQSNFDFGTDENNAHVQPNGQYHYHGMPEGFVLKRGGNSSIMTLIGWALDGFPIYARYGYSVSDDATSELKAMKGSYELVAEVAESRPSVDMYELGTFEEDWQYVAGVGDLDECNGRYGVTPEFPDGIYHYFGTDTYPYIQRCVRGEVVVEERRARPEGGKKPKE